jgi:hypothetical protein
VEGAGKAVTSLLHMMSFRQSVEYYFLLLEIAAVVFVHKDEIYEILDAERYVRSTE